MWFRRKNKPDSDQSVLNSTLVSLQGLLDEKPIEPEAGERREPNLPPPEDADPVAPAPATAMTSADDNEVPDREDAADAATAEPAPEADAGGAESSGSSWADLDLHFDEVESTMVLPAIEDAPDIDEPELAADPEPTSEPDAEPETAVTDDRPPADSTAPETHPDPRLTEEPLEAQPQYDDDATEDDPPSTLFDVIPTLNEIVFDPQAHTSDATITDSIPTGDSALAPTEPESESAMPAAPAPVAKSTLAPVEPESQDPEPAMEDPSVIVPGVTSAPQPGPESISQTETSAATDSPAVPLSPGDFAEHVIQQLRLEYAQHLGRDLPTPFADAARGIMQKALQDWIAQARTVLQRK